MASLRPGPRGRRQPELSAAGKMLAAKKKIVKAGGEPDEFEEQVAQVSGARIGARRAATAPPAMSWIPRRHPRAPLPAGISFSTI